MYCTNCGTKLDDNSKFCSQCGTKVGTIAEKESVPIIKPDKILKQAKFRLKRGTFGWGEKGTLTLFCDRLEWKGDSQFVVRIKDIVNVAVKDLLGTGVLEINDGEGSPYKFNEVNVTGTVMAATIDVGLGAMTGMVHQELESWRHMIEKFRGGE